MLLITFIQHYSLLSSTLTARMPDVILNSWFTSTEAIRLIRDGSPGRPLLLNSGDSEWLVECCFTSTETVGLLGTGAQDGHLDFHAALEL